MVLGSGQWDDLWRDVASRLVAERAAGRGHLLTEDVLRYQTILALGGLGISPARLRVEFLSPHLRGGKVDLVVDPPGSAAVEFKFPRDSSTGTSPDTMTFGELLKDILRMPLVQAEARWIVQAINPRLGRYLTQAARRIGFECPSQSGSHTVLLPEHVTALPATAARSLGGLVPSAPIGLTCRLAARLDEGLSLFAHTVEMALKTAALSTSQPDPSPAPADVGSTEPLRAREGARREILDTVAALLTRTAEPDAALKAIVVEMHRRGTSYAESTIRTMVTSHLCADTQGPGIADHDHLVYESPGLVGFGVMDGVAC